MAVPKSRSGRTGQSPMPGAGISNPFVSTSTFGASQNNAQPTFPASGGFTFGTSQSFPASDTSNSSFNFSVPGQSSSFTFGQPVDNNPFANLNGGASDQQQNSQDSADTMMESPQKKPAFGTGVFGSSDKDKSQSTGFAFGQPSSQPSFSFGQSQQQAQPNGFGNTSSAPLFGQNTSKPLEQTSASTLFGQSTQGQSSTPLTGGVFGQNSTASQQSQSSGFKFGPPSTSAPSSAPTFEFGQASTQPTSSGTLFGNLTQTSQPTFGSSVSASQPATSAPLFGAIPSTSNSNVFSGFGSPSPVETTTRSESPKPSLFGQSATGKPQEESKPATPPTEVVKVNPFASLFGSKPTEPTSESAVATPKPAFNFAPAATGSSPFGAQSSKLESNNMPSEETSKKPLFGFSTSSATPGTNSFSAKSTSEAPPPANPFANLSAKKPEPSKQNSNSVAEAAKETPSKPAGGFQPLPSFGNTPSTNINASDIFGAVNKPQAATPVTASKRSATDMDPPTTTSTTSLFGSAKPQEPLKSATSQLSSTPKTTSALPNVTSLTANATVIGEAPSRSVNTNPPTRIPPYLNGDDYKAYDSNYRLHSLNREFQKRIASLDPSREDFENIVRNYVAARESIGESIGLYTRNVAGMKRKADDDHDENHRDDTASSKKSRPDSFSPSKSTFGTSQSHSSVFKPVPPSTSTSSSPAKSSTAAVSNASSIFSSMIPKSGGLQSENGSENPFANLNKTPAVSQTSTSTKPTFSFGATSNGPTSVESTTPTKSPPKKSGFEMPKFTATGGVNFMDSFKKQSEANAKKLAREAKEKRKLEDFDSDEDNEEEWERKYEEEEKAKRAEIKSIAQKGFTPIFGSAASSSDSPIFGFGSSTGAASKSAPGSTFGDQTFGRSSDKPIDISDNDADEDEEEETGSGESPDADEDEETETNEDDLPEDEVDGDDEEEEDESLEAAIARSKNKGKSLFERVTPKPNMQGESTAKKTNGLSVPKETIEKSNVFSNALGKGTPEAPSFSPLTPAGSKEPYVPSKTFNFVPTPPTTSSTPTPGASIFAGGLMKDGPVSGEGLFGSRPSTPSNGEKPKSNIFGGFGTPVATGADNTWKRGSEIKFGTSDQDAPIVSITEATPRKDESKPFANLFGATATSKNAPAGSSLGFNFGSSPAPGFLSATSHLTGNSGTSSGMSSRATSPGTTDNESVATNEEDYSNDTQVSLMETRPGEENETILSEIRARALRWYSEDQIEGTKLEKGWNAVGLGIARLLKNRETNKTRIVMRAEPGANIILNTNLQPQVKYDFKPSGSNGGIVFDVFTNEGAQKWLLKVKTHKAAQDMVKLMEESKRASV